MGGPEGFLFCAGTVVPPAPLHHHRQPTMTDFRAALKQLADAVDGWEMDPAKDDPLAIAMDHARKLLQAAEEGERLSSGKLVSERIVELLAEVEQRDLVPVEIVVGTRALQLLRREVRKALNLS